MTEKHKLNSKTWAKIALVILLLSIAGENYAYFQTKRQLVSPLIPQSTILTVSEPFIFFALCSSLLSIAALLFYFFAKYWITIGICLGTLLFQQFYVYG